jgi:Gas vesicle protein
VIDRILDKGVVIDAFVRVSLVGIELLSIELRAVVASVETWLTGPVGHSHHKDPPHMTTPEQRRQMAAAIVDFEARRDAAGHLMVYHPPTGDGGGAYEVAGINVRYNRSTATTLAGLIGRQRFEEAERLATDFIARNTDCAASWTDVPAVEFYLRDCVFNRGATGGARICNGCSASTRTPGSDHKPGRPRRRPIRRICWRSCVRHASSTSVTLHTGTSTASSGKAWWPVGTRRSRSRNDSP